MPPAGSTDNQVPRTSLTLSSVPFSAVVKTTPLGSGRLNSLALVPARTYSILGVLAGAVAVVVVVVVVACSPVCCACAASDRTQTLAAAHSVRAAREEVERLYRWRLMVRVAECVLDVWARSRELSKSHPTRGATQVTLNRGLDATQSRGQVPHPRNHGIQEPARSRAMLAER